MFDYHIHPNYSIDADGEIEEFCRAALNAGLKEIAFTTHLDTDRVADDCYVNVKGKRVDVSSSEWFEDYELTIRNAGEHFSDSLGGVITNGEIKSHYSGEPLMNSKKTDYGTKILQTG